MVLRASDQILRYSIDKSTVELLYLPVAPRVKLAVKAFIDTVVWRLGDGLSGVGVLVLVTWGGLSARQVSWVNIAVIVAWGAAAVRARREYVETLRESIQQHRLDAERASAPLLDRSATDMLGDHLQATDPQEILYALGLLELGGHQATHPAVRGLLEHSAPEVRQRAIAILNAAGDTGVSGSVERLLLDPHLEVRTEALLYLSRHKHQDPLTRIEELGDFADFSIHAALVAFLAHPGPAQNLPAARVLFERMVADPGPESRRGQIGGGPAHRPVSGSAFAGSPPRVGARGFEWRLRPWRPGAAPLARGPRSGGGGERPCARWGNRAPGGSSCRCSIASGIRG